jgi:hypothetical protein
VEKLEGTQERTASVTELVMEDLDRLNGEVEDLKALPEPRPKRRIGFQIATSETKNIKASATRR